MRSVLNENLQIPARALHEKKQKVIDEDSVPEESVSLLTSTRCLKGHCGLSTIEATNYH